jgi:hypothetical protein
MNAFHVGHQGDKALHFAFEFGAGFIALVE